MSRALPSPWSQTLPRSVRLAPGGLLVPVRTLRILLAPGRTQELIHTGFAFEPWVRDGQTIRVQGGACPRRGDLVLCEEGGWGDLRRMIGRSSREEIITALDVLPSGRGRVPEGRIIGVVRGARGAGGRIGSFVALAFPIWARLAALVHWRRRILEAPLFVESAAESVREKYSQQVEGYTALVHYPLEPELLQVVRGRLSPGATVLVAGSGAGGELIHLARAGFRVTGIDFAPAMVEAGRRNAAAARIEAEILEGDLVTLDLPGRAFDLIYVTPLVYSFIARRDRRIDALRRLGAHLARGGIVVFSAHLVGGPVEWLETRLAWLRNRLRGGAGEPGDWYTWFLTPGGTIGKSFIRRFDAREVIGEARAAGFRHLERAGRAHFMAERFDGPNR